jgi:disulfide bond formation protein DsbB
VTHDVIVFLAALGLVGQVAVFAFAVLLLLRVAGVAAPLERVRATVWGYELWLAFLVSAVATLGSLYLSERAHFFPCELCWFQRIFMYPLALTTLAAALANDHRVARYLLPLPVVGAAFSGYHLLVENGVVEQAQGCRVSAPGGCTTKWIDEFGYVTIPTLALTAFALVFAFLLLAAVERDEPEPAAQR